MLGCILILTVVMVTSAVPRAATTSKAPFVWNDCTSDQSSQAVEIVSLSASPIPVFYPGQLKLQIGALVKKPIHAGYIFQLQFTKHGSQGKDIIMPCIGTFGSCALDACVLLNTTRNLFVSIGAHVDCPLQPHNATIHIPDFTFHVPDLSQSDVMSTIGDGDYQITIKTVNPATGRELGCLTFSTGIHKAHAHGNQGLLFGGLGRK